jgi:two-component system, LytTR family, response regulator
VTTIRALIVDDEPLGRALLRALLAETDGVTVVGEARAGAEAVTMALQHTPDCLLLDVEMPGMHGYQVLEAVRQHYQPAAVMITAHSAYAVRAFELGVVDYVTKPVLPARLALALDRVRTAMGTVRPRLDHAVAPSPPAVREPHQDGPTWLALQIETGFRMVRIADIHWLEADLNHVVLKTAEGDVRVRSTLAALLDRLPAHRFARIHRSTAVNLDRIHTIRPTRTGDFFVELSTGDRLRLSRTMRANLHL